MSNTLVDDSEGDAATVVERVRHRLADVTSGGCDLLLITCDGLTVSVVARCGPRTFELDADLRDPDVEWHIAAKLACFLDRAAAETADRFDRRRALGLGHRVRSGWGGGG